MIYDVIFYSNSPADCSCRDTSAVGSECFAANMLVTVRLFVLPATVPEHHEGHTHDHDS